ncbi:tetratricopeptide repeat protein [Peptostreptococcaceae bacterium AGR-M142]
MLNKKIILLFILIFTFVITSACSNDEESSNNKEEVVNKEDDENKVDKDLLFQEDYQKATIMIQEGKLKEAKEELDGLIKSNPNNYNYYFSYGTIFLKERDYKNALEKFNKVIELDSSIIQAYNNIIGIHMLDKEYDKAISVLDKALEIEPENKDLKFKKGQLLFVKESYQESIELLSELKEEEAYFEVYRFIGLSNINLNNKKEAIKNLELYLKKAPDGIPVKESIQKTLADLKK